jgi:hypothetical protein
MSVDNSQGKVRQRTEEARAASLAKVQNRQAIPERNILIADFMVASLDYIVEIIRDNHWGYLYNCAYTVYPRLVKEFYGHLEVIQDKDYGIILQTSVQSNMIQIDLQVINAIINDPVLPILANPFTEVMEPPTLE